MTSGISPRTSYTKLNFDFPYIRSLSLRRDSYLGVIISGHNCDLDLKRQVRKFCTNSANLLIRKFSKCSVDVECYLFITYCSTLYCSAMWFNNTKSAMKNLEVAYNNSLRRLLSLKTYNSASEMFAVLTFLHLEIW